jgi:hypothetical protein
MQTYLKGRLRNTSLPLSHGLMPLFEAVVNSIHAIEERGLTASQGRIRIEVIRLPQSQLPFQSEPRRGAPPLEPIIAFRVIDNGCGFDDGNLSSFETLDSEYKAVRGCRGVGRLLWLKAFDSADVVSTFWGEGGNFKTRRFFFTVNGIGNVVFGEADRKEWRTEVVLKDFKQEYREKSPKTHFAIANALLEHCLWYFVRPGGAPDIEIVDASEAVRLNDVYEAYMHSSAQVDSFEIQGEVFEVTHLKLHATARQPFIAYCAAGRLVREESLVGKIAGLHSRLSDESGEFTYGCFVTSRYLDENVRPERTDFNIKDSDDVLPTPSIDRIRTSAMKLSEDFLEDFLEKARLAAKDRVDSFVATRAPRYRPILQSMNREKLDVSPDISDRDLEALLHRQLSEFEAKLIEDGHDLMRLVPGERVDEYQKRLAEYLARTEDLKKSDLANYVFHRKVVLDVLEKAIEKQADGKYSREDLIHEFIMPMRKTSNEVRFESCNLWLLDERLAFHDFLSSDKPISSFPVVSVGDGKEPDIVALNIFDQPLLVAEQKPPLASIVVVEIKRPMRDDAKAGEEKDPVEQALGYVDRIRQGQVQTHGGRPIPRSEDIPGFCYVVCDITKTVEHRCKVLGLRVTSDKQGYFGYNDNFKCYIEVFSYDRLLSAAKQRNRAFFSKLGLPHN